MQEKPLYAEIVKSGAWLYDNQVPHEVWIVRQNFDYYYEEGYEDGPEIFNSDGELFHIVFAFKGTVRTVVPATLSLSAAGSDAEERMGHISELGPTTGFRSSTHLITRFAKVQLKM